jgi:hypothetical protein
MTRVEIEKKILELADRLRVVADRLEGLETVTSNTVKEVEETIRTAEAVVELEELPIPTPIEELPVEQPKQEEKVSMITTFLLKDLENLVTDIENDKGDFDDNMKKLKQKVDDLETVYPNSDALKELKEQIKRFESEPKKSELDNEIVKLVEKIKEANPQIPNYQALMRIFGMQRWRQLSKESYSRPQQKIIKENLNEIRAYFN